MDTWAWIILVVFALFVGLVAQYIIRGGSGLEWALVSVGVGAAAYFSSEYDLGGFGNWGATILGMHVFPAFIGGVIVAVLLTFLLHMGEQTTSQS